MRQSQHASLEVQRWFVLESLYLTPSQRKFQRALETHKNTYLAMDATAIDEDCRSKRAAFLYFMIEKSGIERIPDHGKVGYAVVLRLVGFPNQKAGKIYHGLVRWRRTDNTPPKVEELFEFRLRTRATHYRLSCNVQSKRIHSLSRATKWN